ncbi:carbon storage regulator CsrA [Gimesia sp.]|uniref:carbon storage regulator CsrA n=1 Tax=Gimesia sp. TaxID=2024833 RepID=UPI003A8F3D19
MLVLSRSRNEKILIGDNIEVMVVDVRGDKVRLGIIAPKDVPVHREEVYIAIQQEQRLKDEAEERKWREWAERKGKPCS